MNGTFDRLAAILELDVDSPELEAKALALADLFLERKPASGRFHHLHELEHYRRLRGGKPVSL